MDYNATAPLLPQVAEAMTAAFGAFGNPSSIHTEGRAARKIAEDSRRAIARALRALPQQVFFFGSGSEANAFALRPGLRKGGVAAARLITTSVEHPCVLRGHGFAADEVRLLKVDGHGVIDLADLRAALAEDERPALVSVMLANNETGVIQPVMEVANLLEGTSHILHSDVVQALGKIEVNFRLLGADIITVSAHKCGGPKGIGALVRRDDSIEFAPAMIRGGGQERNMRAGTENVPAIAGFGVAVEAAVRYVEDGVPHKIGALRDLLEQGLCEIDPATHMFARDVARLPNTSCFALEGIAADVALIRFDLEGVSVSSGSACSSGKVAASHVLSAMGVPKSLASGAIRASLGWASTEEDVRKVLAAWQGIVAEVEEAKQRRAAI